MTHFIQFLKAGESQARIGALRGQHVVDLTAAAPALGHDLSALFANHGAGLKQAAAIAAAAPAHADLRLTEITFLPPVLRPSKIVCLGLNYADHAAEGGHARPDYPSFFMRGASSLIGHNAPLIRPKASTKLDFEAEVAVIIGTRCRHLSAESALAAVAGYSCFNDGSLRDYQRKTNQWTIGKNFDGTGAFGPSLVPTTDLPAGAVGLKIESRLNGQVMQSSNTAHMLFPVAETLCLITEAMTLEPGDVVIMGTPAGVGYARTPPVWMAPGDRIEIEIEGMGILSNPIADEA